MTDLRNLKVDELKDIARSRGMVGAWKMTKDRLIEGILKNAELNGIHEYYDSTADQEVIENEPESIETVDNEINQEPEQNEPEREPESESDVPEETLVEEKPKPKRGQLIEFEGKSQNICAWGKELGISSNTLYGRIYSMGWSVERAFTTPSKKK